MPPLSASRYTTSHRVSLVPSAGRAENADSNLFNSVTSAAADEKKKEEETDDDDNVWKSKLS
ncbi:uncharacterized, partial [Tachysurus ichikawai]